MLPRRPLAPAAYRLHLHASRLCPRTSSTKSDSLSDRLPTISASEALLSIQSRGPPSLSTGLSQLDNLLGASNRGLGRGKITEIWGPSGSGKSSLALQTATHALNNGSSVVWVGLSFLAFSHPQRECAG